MKADKRFLGLSLDFWANVRLLSQEIGYTERKKNRVKIPTQEEIVKAYNELRLDHSKLVDKNNKLTKKGKLIIQYFDFRAKFLNDYVEPNLMKVNEAAKLFKHLKKTLKPTCLLPINKQSGTKKTYAYFTSIINILIEANSGVNPVNYDPKELTSFAKDKFPVRTLSRRVDGAFPDTVNPIAIWEIKEYYYTTTFGSRIADGVYETQLDGMELMEVKKSLNLSVDHCLMVDAYDTWWLKGKSYLCRICDMLHIGILSEALFGKEVLTRVPELVDEWIKKLNTRKG